MDHRRKSTPTREECKDDESTTNFQMNVHSTRGEEPGALHEKLMDALLHVDAYERVQRACAPCLHGRKPWVLRGAFEWKECEFYHRCVETRSFLVLRWVLNLLGPEMGE